MQIRIFCYGYSNGHAAAAPGDYLGRFPNCQSCSWETRAFDPEDEDVILQHFENDLNTSTNIVAYHLGMSEWKVCWTVNN